MSHSLPLLILGGGYTGRVIYRHATLLKRPLLISSRRPEAHLTDIPPENRRCFDLKRPNTRASVPDGADIIWTFPAVPIDRVMDFAKKTGFVFQRLIVIGSTSAYRTGLDPLQEWIDESSPIDRSVPRVAGEEYLREAHGAMILRSAGIYGPGRNPLNWIREGHIGYTDRWVNLIHIEDLAAICLQALQNGKPGEIYNISDGTPRRWSDIMEAAESRWNIPRPAPFPEAKPGKKISNRKVLNAFHYRLRFPDLYTALAEIEPPFSPSDRQPGQL